jgi:glycosyltransferase involved in cell wall biosynthesis
MQTLSVCCIARNEEQHIASMIASIKSIATEIIVLDTGSIDRTVQIASAAGAKVESIQWTDDFAAARNKVMSMAANEWILMLDADEIIAPDSLEKIQHFMQQGRRAYSCMILNAFPMQVGTMHLPFMSTRLFRRDKNLSYTGLVDETIEPSLKKLTHQIYPTDIVIHHLGYLDDKHVRRLRNRRLFEAGLSQNPTEAWVRAHLGLGFYLEKEYVKAEENFGIALSTQDKALLPETRAIIMAMLAFIQRSQGKAMQSRTQAQRALQLLKGNIMAEIVLAGLDIDAGSLEAAARRYLSIDTNSLGTRLFTVHRGMLITEVIKCHLKLGQLEKSRQFAEMILDQPTLEAMMIAGAISEKYKDYHAALHFFRLALPLSSAPHEIQARIDLLEQKIPR